MGSFKKRNYTRRALDQFCRDDRTAQNLDGPTYTVMDSGFKMRNGTAWKQIVPNKTRCGNLDPVEMNVTDKCYCLAKDNVYGKNQGAGNCQR